MLTTIYVEIDDFNKKMKEDYKEELEELYQNKKMKSRLSQSEIMTILVYYHLSGYKTFKDYYTKHVSIHLREYFPDIVSYTRFVELIPSVLFPLSIFLKNRKMGKCTGISFIDSTPIRVCKNQRIPRNKVFKGYAERGKSTMGWFYGFKLHLIINENGEIISFCLTEGNVDDRNPELIEKMITDIFGKLFGDKGYISGELSHNLLDKGIHLVTRLKSNMKNILIELKDALLLSKRRIIETVNDQLKNICQIEHSRHRSVTNFLVNIISGITAYCFKSKKPSVDLEYYRRNDLLMNI